MVIKDILRKNKGIIVSDAIVATLIIFLFAGIITSLMTNIYLEAAKIKISSQQIDFATEIFEYAEKIDYEEVSETNLIQYIRSKNINSVKAAATLEEIQEDNAYKIAVNVESYIPTDANLPKIDLVKTITVTIEKKLLNKSYTTTISNVRKARADEIIKIIGE